LKNIKKNLSMPCPKGAWNKKGKQSAEERKAKRKASSTAHSAESRQKDYAKKKMDRREKKLEQLNARIKQQRYELYSIGRFAGANDPAMKDLGKLLESPLENKLDYVAQNSNIILEPDTDLSHLNRMTMIVFHCKLQHKGKGCKSKTLPKFIQSELQKSAMKLKM